MKILKRIRELEAFRRLIRVLVNIRFRVNDKTKNLETVIKLDGKHSVGVL